jgi:hypothetical protein
LLALAQQLHFQKCSSVTRNRRLPLGEVAPDVTEIVGGAAAIAEIVSVATS